MNDIIPYAESLLQNSQYSALPIDYTAIFNNDVFLPSYLTKNIGKWMKIEHYIDGQPHTHIGQLIKVGMNFIVLKLSRDKLSSIICNLADLKFITIIYDKNIDNL